MAVGYVICSRDKWRKNKGFRYLAAKSKDLTGAE